MSQLSELENEKTKSITFSHHWTIDNFTQFYDENVNKWKWQMCSNDFSPPYNDAFEFYAYLHLSNQPDKEEDDDGGYLGIEVVPTIIPKHLNGKVFMKSKQSIVDKSGKKCYTVAYTASKMVASMGELDDEYISLSKLLDISNGYLNEGKLILDIEIKLTSTEPVFVPPTSTSPSVTQSDATAPVVHLSHTFTIDHFEWMMMQVNAPLCISSDYFASQNELIGKFRVDLYPHGENGTDSSSISISIVNHSAVNANVHYCVSLVNSDSGERCFEEEHQIKIYKNSEIPINYPSQLILNPSNRLLPSGKLTIQCELDVMIDDITQLDSPHETKHYHSDTIKTVSTVDIAQYCIHRAHLTWQINQFTADCFHKRVIIDSETFQPNTDPKYSFSLRLHPKESDNTNADYTVICLSSLLNVEETEIQYRIAVIDAAGEMWKSWAGENTISKIAKIDQFSLLPHDKLKQFSDTLLPNDTLTISCEIWIWEKRMN